MYGEIYDSLDGSIDSFMETYMGKYGRVEFEGDCGKFDVYNLSAIKVNSLVTEFKDFLLGLNDELDAKKDSDLLNLRDDMLAQVNRLAYLLTLQ